MTPGRFWTLAVIVGFFVALFLGAVVVLILMPALEQH